MKDKTMEDTYLDMCINQGYVPVGCTLNGVVVWHEVNAGKNPCKNCRNSKCEVRRCPNNET